MLARLGDLPKGKDDEKFAYEIKWDGIRAIYFSQPGEHRIESRNLKDITSRWPELRALGRELGARDGVFDGEIVTLNDEGKPSFQLLQSRMHLASESAVRRRMKSTPAIYMIFDLIYLDGRDLTDLPYTERRELLESLELDGPNWKVPSYHVGDGKALLDASKAQGLEGVIAKRLDCPYTPASAAAAGSRSRTTQRQELVVGGWLPGEGNRSGQARRAAVGHYDTTPTEARKRGSEQEFKYAGGSARASPSRRWRAAERARQRSSATTRRSTAASRRRARTSSIPSWSPRSSSASGPERDGPPPVVQGAARRQGRERGGARGAGSAGAVNGWPSAAREQTSGGFPIGSRPSTVRCSGTWPDPRTTSPKARHVRFSQPLVERTD